MVQTLPRSFPEEQGVASSGIRDFLASLKHSDIELHSFILLRHGAVISEAWWSPYQAKYPHMIFSLSKCFTSTAVGFAVSEKRLSLDDRVAAFFPDEEILEDRNLNGMRVRDLLTMSTGHNSDIMGELWKEKNSNWLKAFLTTLVEHPPGTHFAYNNGAAYMLSAILQKVTGMTLLEYLLPRLFEPLGIDDVTWDLSPGGRNPGGWGLILKTEDIARFGQLYLNKGVWQGNGIVSEEWVQEATSKQVSIDDHAKDEKKYGYGYQFWLNQYGYNGSGAFGQFLVVLPEQEAVVAITGATNNMQGILSSLWEHVIPAMGGEQLEPNATDYHELQAEIASLTHSTIPSKSQGVPVDDHSSGQYVLELNDLGMKTFGILFKEDDCEILLSDARGDHRILCGIGEWVSGETNWPVFKSHITTITNRLWLVFATGTWVDTATFTMTWLYVESPFWDRVTLHFQKDSITVDFSRNLSLESSFSSAVLTGKIAARGGDVKVVS